MTLTCINITPTDVEKKQHKNEKSGIGTLNVTLQLKRKTNPKALVFNDTYEALISENPQL